MRRLLLSAALCLALPAWAEVPAAGEPDTVLPDTVPPVTSPMERLLDLGTANTSYASCCKHCRKGKACGDSCISREKSCRKGQGCACD